MSAPETSLTAVELTTLDDLELVIEQGLAGFIEVGAALGRIRDRKLYRATHSTFEVYVRERWGLSRSVAYQRIDAAEVAGTLSAIADTPNEAVTRALAPLKDAPEKLRETWNNVVELHGPKPTAGQVRDIVAGDGDVAENDDHHHGDRAGRTLSKARGQRASQACTRLLLISMLFELDDALLDDIEGIEHFDRGEFLQGLRAGRRGLNRLIRRVEERGA